MQAGGLRTTGRLISELDYHRSVTAVVRAGNAAPTAQTFQAYEKVAEGKREENARRIAGRPHTPVPELPEALHIASDAEGADGGVWRFQFEAIEAWSLLEFGIELPPSE